MQISKRWEGFETAPRAVSITARDLMNFAAAIGEQGPRYLDDRRPGGVVSVPTYCTALTWSCVQHLWDGLIAAGCSAEVVSRQVHYTATIDNRRPMRDGDRLMLHTRVHSLTPHRAGTLLQVDVTGTDADDELVFRERIGGILRGVQCEGVDTTANATAESASTLAAPDWSETFEIHPLLPYRYDSGTGIHFPIHTSRRFAESVGLPGIIVQGTASLAICVQKILARYVGDAGDGLVPRLHAQFSDFLLPGTTARLEAQQQVVGDDRIGIAFSLIGTNDRPAIRGGYVELPE